MKFLRFLLWYADYTYEHILMPLIGKIWLLEMRVRGVNIYKKSLIYGRPVIKIHPLSHVSINESFSMVSNNRRSTAASLYSPCRIVTHSETAKIIIGKNTGVNGCSIVARSKTIITGDRCKLAANVIIMDSPYHNLEFDKREFYYGEEDNDVTIDNDCWIGNGCLILPGSIIGRGCVVGARSVVNKQFPPNCLIAGAPAKLIRYLL